MSPKDPTPSMLLSFGRDSVLRDGVDGKLVVDSRGSAHDLGVLPAAVHAAAQALASGRHAMAELVDLATAKGGPFASMQLVQHVRAWDERGLVHHTVPCPEGVLATMVPISAGYTPPTVAPDPSTHYVLSRFSLLRRVDEALALESPLAHARIVLHDCRAASIVHELAAGTTLARILDREPNPGEPSIRLFVGLLLSAGMLTRVDEDGQPEEDDVTMRHWEPHDLLFHARSRRGRHSAPLGRTERFRDLFPPTPAVKASMSKEAIALPVPNMAEIEERDMSLLETMETRRSLRAHGSAPLDITRLGEFLYRTARNEDPRPGPRRSYEHLWRPYPSGGSCYELELYMVIGDRVGLDPGLYHYAADRHAACRLRGMDEPTRRLLDDARSATGENGPAQVLMVLAARFQRVSWAYESIAYSLVLKHVGVVMQSMYLVATSMGLAACALGAGDSDAFARATGLDYYEEGSVGELLLGTRP